jgi:hypothetical protein
VSRRLVASLTLSLFLLIAAGCVSTTKQGLIVMKVDARTAHVSLQSGSVAEGDTVSLIESRCPAGPRGVTTRKPKSDKCRKVVVGQGTVRKVLNDRYAVAEFPAGLGFEEGDAVHAP